MIRITDVLERASTKNILEFYGVQFNSRNFALCPFHPEKTPSLSYNPKTDKYKCFSCGKGGDGINFVREYFGLSTPQALKKINDDLSLGLDRPLTRAEKKSLAEERQIAARLNEADKALKAEGRRLSDLWSSILRQVQGTGHGKLQNTIEAALDTHDSENLKFLPDILTGRETVFVIKTCAKNLMGQKIERDEFYGICGLFQQEQAYGKGAETCAKPHLRQPKFTVKPQAGSPHSPNWQNQQETQREAAAGIEL